MSDLKAADQGSAAVLHVSDGSYYIRVVVSLEAVEMAEWWVSPHLSTPAGVTALQLLARLSADFIESWVGLNQ